ncbi:DNA polymerase III, subunit gamma and tau, partial [Staphylococcus aureus]
NCTVSTDGWPCNSCDTCVSITKGTNSDVIEIDAASNNGVDEIRNIRDKVKYAPGESTYKVYIIDEVHMLTTGAFNALLKTLEEPPAHAVFILATTEPHKIPATIISRCQRFDFKAISVNDIAEHLAYVCRTEGIKYDEGALNFIATTAEGGMRDALSILDQA